ncbi:MAG: hypothetical protein SNH27_13495 [Rikenellaceae bacterium]
MKKIKSVVNTPIKQNIIANLFGIGVQLFNQIILVPFYLHFWDTNLYSDWIVIAAISSFFSMSDIGLNSVTNNDFVIHYASNKKRCTSLLTNNYALIIIIASVALLGSFLYINCFDITKSLNLNEINRGEGNYIFIALIAHIFIGMYSSVRHSIYRANSLTHRGAYISNTVRLSESLVILLSLLLRLPMSVMVTIYLFPQIISTIYFIVDTNKLFHYSFKFSQIDIPLLKQIAIPSISFMAFPIGNAIVYQGFTLVVNKFMGADSVVLFNTTRTLCNFMRRLLDTTQSSVWPEYSRAYGANNIDRMRQLHRKSFRVVILGGVVLSIGVLILGPTVYRIWLQDKVLFDYSLMISFLVITLLKGACSASSVCLMATNKHSTLGLLYLITAFLAIGTSIVVIQYTKSLSLMEYSLIIDREGSKKSGRWVIISNR